MRGFVVVVWFDCIFVGGRFVVGVLCFFIVGFVFFRDFFRETGERGSVEVCDLLDLEGGGEGGGEEEEVGWWW